MEREEGRMKKWVIILGKRHLQGQTIVVKYVLCRKTEQFIWRDL